MKTAFALAGAFLLAASLTATAADAPTSTGECSTLLEQVEGAVEAKALSGEAADKANELLLQLDKQCADGEFAGAKTTADELEALAG